MLFVGHRNLWQAGILHGDVSINNVLIRKPNAEVGNRGVLIDMDMAILLDRMESLASVDFRTVSSSRFRVVSDKFYGACRVHELSSPSRCSPVSMILLAKHCRTIILTTSNHFSTYYAGLRLATLVPIIP